MALLFDVAPAACMTKLVTYSCVTISATRFMALLFDVAPAACVAKHVTYSYGDEFSNTLHGAAIRFKAPTIEWHLQLSQLKRIHALFTVSGRGFCVYAYCRRCA
jgi:hypothetical protein